MKVDERIYDCMSAPRFSVHKKKNETEQQYYFIYIYYLYIDRSHTVF